MSDTNKVLEVAYGTFACRLEGFDDSVETMKTVVSYFHELAGHDRFMDMDPQAPDMETLARLTEEQAGGTVEVDYAEDDRISLRLQQLGSNQEVEATPEVAIDPTPQIEEGAEWVEDEDHDQEIAEGEDAATDWAEEIDEADTAAEDVDEANDPGEDIDEEAEEEDTGALEADVEEDAAEVLEAEVEEDTDDHLVADEPDDQDDPFLSDDNLTAETEVTPTLEEESVAEKLQRIRAVVGRVPPPPSASVFAAQEATDDTAVEEPAPAEMVDDFDFQKEPDNDDTPIVLTDDQDDDLSDHATPDADDFAGDETADNDDLDPATPESENTTEDAVEAAPFVDAENRDEGFDDDDEVDLHEEVAEVANEIAKRRENRSKRDNLPDNDDDAMKRILSQADEKLNEPEGRRHRDAFAQLKAAVAATEAARQLGDQTADVDPKDAFQDDLDEVVRTNAEDDVDDAADDDGDAQGAPLKLVAEQRVDGAEAPGQLDQTAARLRQIASVKEAPANTPGGFAEFAAEKGATDLADLLEAAAAYIAFVEGDDDFSRPQVMKKVQMASSDEFSREDGLRSFGRLLRQSKIIKLNNGRFQVSEDTRFKPDGKAAQG